MNKILLVFILVMMACGKKDSPAPPPPPPPPPPVFDINLLNDTYGAIAPFSSHTQWGPYNVHDPSVIKSGQYFYSFSTDVAYGTSVRAGLQIRKSKDLVEWSFVGWVFNSLPSMVRRSNTSPAFECLAALFNASRTARKSSWRCSASSGSGGSPQGISSRSTISAASRNSAAKAAR